MLFPTLEYLLFFLVVFFLYWYVFPLFPKNQFITHIFLLFASYFFYMCWDYRFSVLILLSTALDFYLGILIDKSNKESKRKFFLIMSLVVNLFFILGFFKYYNFLANSGNSLLSFIGIEEKFKILNIILPVGVSFYTFQSLSYTIDVYRRLIPYEKSFIKFALFVSFFPQLVAGPIVVAKSFLPQLDKRKDFNDIPFIKSIRYLLLGYFKKVVLSDNISPISDMIYGNPEIYGTEACWLAAFLFWVQVYCDFSGYTDMAYGSALLLGYELPENFNLPYLSRSITEHWRRWHITLSTWLRDYVYISLGGSKVSNLHHKFNVWFTMFVGGIWHGANWTFVIWGAMQGTLLMIESIYKDLKNKIAPDFKIPENGFTKLLQILITSFFTITLGTCFRADSIEKEIIIISKMFNYTEGIIRPYMYKKGSLAILSVIFGHLIGYYIFEKKIKIKIKPWVEICLIPFVILLLLFLTPNNEVPFIYFQF